MKTIRLAVAALVVLAAGLLTAAPAHAGNWALTVLDPLPARIEAATTYTVGYWVLQHGFHPYSYEGELGPTGITLVAENGETVEFIGVQLAEPAHYAAPLVVPRNGTWQVIANQGRFQDHHLGTLTVPGSLTLLPPPMTPLDRTMEFWGTVHPDVSVLHLAAEQVPQPVAVQAPAPQARPVAEPEPAMPVVPILGGAAGLVAVGGGVLLFRRRSRNPHA
jgi:hypothetical protein